MQIDPQLLQFAGAGMAIGIFLGVLIAALFAMRHVHRLRTANAVLTSELKAEQQLELEREKALKEAGEKLAASFESLAGKSMRDQSETFLKLASEHLGKHHEIAKGDLGDRQKAITQLIQPIADALKKNEAHIAQIEKERIEAFSGIKSQLNSMSENQVALQTETRNLVNALRRPEVRGQWGEITLRRVVELAGMVEHCDFTEQAHTETEDGAIRPDMIINMPERRDIVVDVKTPLDAYIEATETQDEDARKTALTRHVSNLKGRIKELASKAYWSQFKNSPEFVVLFVPGDQFLAAALDQEPALQEHALKQKIILATPTTLFGLLKVVAYGWRQLALAENAEKIHDIGKDLYERLATFSGHLARVGKQLGSSIEAYNSAVGSLEHKVLPGARKFTEMGIKPKNVLEELNPVDKTPRTPQSLDAPDDNKVSKLNR